MSLSSFLLGSSSGQASTKKAKVIDSDLDALFRTSTIVAPTPVPAPVPTHKSRKKRKEHDDAEADGAPISKKKVKASKQEKHAAKVDLPVAEKAAQPKKSKGKEKEAKIAQRKKVLEDSDEDDEDDAGVEDAYLSARAKVSAEKPTADEEKDASASSSSDEDGDSSQLVHESVLKKDKKSKSRPAKAAKFVPEDETPEQRDARTVFVGNVPVDVAKGKSAAKQFRRHILSHLPTAKIESTRFRSVAFQNPTSKLTEDGTSAPQKPPLKPDSDGRAHDRERAASWRQKAGGEYEQEREKKRLTPQEKKRVAFIKHEIHAEAASVNAYVVFAHAVPGVPAEVMDPYEAARLAVETCDGTVFMERTLRVDRVGAARGGEQGAMGGDPKRTLFVGNLDFASKDEDLRTYFEGVMSTERGPRGAGDDSEDEAEDSEDEEREAGKPKTWVVKVRIIRDKDTQLGKGFAYVQFADRECVDELLAMEEGKLKFAKRKLRVQRCKTLPGSKTKISSTAKPGKPTRPDQRSDQPKPARTAPRTPIVVPKGDPTLGAKLAHLPKDQRKEAKQADADRVARRLAKKKARNALGKAGVKEKGKDRERVRKSPKDRKAGAAKEQKKGRIRSERALTKRNEKK